MRLIDADALRKKVLFWADIENLKEHNHEQAKAYNHCLGLIDEAPTADAVEVVRCKDCKHWYLDADTGMACEFTNMGQPEDGFCNWAEKKGERNDTY